MSRVHRFIGNIDAPYKDSPNICWAFVFGTTPGTPLFGVVTIPVKCIKSSFGELRDGDKIEGRMCPRGLRVWVTSRKAPEFQRWLHEQFAPRGTEDVQALDAYIRRHDELLYAETYQKLLERLERRVGSDDDFIDIVGFVYGEYERVQSRLAERLAAMAAS